jgi:hypothetical protein
LSYRRNPEAAEAALKRKVEVEQLVNEALALAKSAAEAKVPADKLAADSRAEAKRSAEMKMSAGKAAADAEAKSKAASDKLIAAKTAVDNDKNNQALRQALTAAEKSAAEAAAQLKTSLDAEATADKAADEAEVKAKSAGEAKVAADKAAADADAKAKRATAAKAEADKLAADAENAAKPNNVAVGFPSTVVTVKVTAAPVTLAVQPPAALKQAMKLELPVAIQRLYGFTGPLQINSVLPQGVSGLSIPQLTIAGDKNQGVIVIEANANATVGKHLLSLQTNMQFNGQNLQIIETVPLVIEKVEVAEQK